MHQSGAQADGGQVTDQKNDPYQDGEVPADADISETSESTETSDDGTTTTKKTEHTTTTSSSSSTSE
jgi:hypothetical protein